LSNYTISDYEYGAEEQYLIGACLDKSLYNQYVNVVGPTTCCNGVEMKNKVTGKKGYPCVTREGYVLDPSKYSKSQEIKDIEAAGLEACDKIRPPYTTQRITCEAIRDKDSSKCDQLPEEWTEEERSKSECYAFVKVAKGDKSGCNFVGYFADSQDRCTEIVETGEYTQECAVDLDLVPFGSYQTCYADAIAAQDYSKCGSTVDCLGQVSIIKRDAFSAFKYKDTNDIFVKGYAVINNEPYMCKYYFDPTQCFPEALGTMAADMNLKSRKVQAPSKEPAEPQVNPNAALIPGEGYACEWSWPQKVKGKQSSAIVMACTEEKPYCNSIAAGQGTIECCESCSGSGAAYSCSGCA
jgi:hypothetical protein